MDGNLQRALLRREALLATTRDWPSPAALAGESLMSVASVRGSSMRVLIAPLSALLALSVPTIGAAAEDAAALAGRVSSAAEGPMEGVVVSAKRAGSTKTISVVSRADGAYSFPRERLEAGRYELAARAVNYVLDRSAVHAVDVAADKTAHLDLELRGSNALELALAPTDPEWFASYPLDDKTKFDLLRDCSRCHTLRRPSMSTYDEEELAWVMMRMVYSAGSSPMSFQLPASRTPHWGRAEGGEPSALQRRQAQAIGAVNLSKGMWSYELKTLPRPTGNETEVIYTDVGSARDESAARHTHRARRLHLVQPFQRQRDRPPRSENR